MPGTELVGQVVNTIIIWLIVAIVVFFIWGVGRK